MANQPTVPAWLVQQASIGANPYGLLQDADYDDLLHDPGDPEYERELAERIAHRQATDQKINAALADDFWEDDCDSLCSDGEDDNDDCPPVGSVKTLKHLASGVILESLSLEEKVGVLGHLPTSFDSYQSMVEYLLDHELNDRFLDAREELQASAIWHMQIAHEHGFDTELIAVAIRNALLSIAFTQREKGETDLGAIQIAYRAIAMALSTLERLKCFLVFYVGPGRLIQCAEWAIQHGEAELGKLTMPSIGSILRAQPRRLPISYEMLDTLALSERQVEMIALRNNACIMVGENPFHLGILFEKSSLDQGAWIEYSRQLRTGRGPCTDKGHQDKFTELGLEVRSRGRMKRIPAAAAAGEDGSDLRSLLPPSRSVPRDVRLKTVVLQGRATIFIGVPNGKQLCWFPQALPQWDRAGPGVAVCDDMGVPSPRYAEEIVEGEKILDSLLDWLSKEGKPLLQDGVLSCKIGDALSDIIEYPFHRSGRSLLNVAILLDVLRDRNPRRGVGKLLYYVHGSESPWQNYRFVHEVGDDQPGYTGWYNYAADAG